MALRCSHDVRVIHMSQSETSGHISIPMLVEDPGPLPEEGL